MPTKKSLPRTNITVRFSYSLNFLSQGVTQQRIKMIEVPFLGILVHKRASEVSSIDGSRVRDCFPELCYIKITIFYFSGLSLPSTLTF